LIAVPKPHTITPPPRLSVSAGYLPIRPNKPSCPHNEDEPSMCGMNSALQGKGHRISSPFRVFRVFRGSANPGRLSPRNTRKDTKTTSGAARFNRRAQAPHPTPLPPRLSVSAGYLPIRPNKPSCPHNEMSHQCAE